MSKALGRGLDALLPTMQPAEHETIVELALDAIRPNPYQPRKTFNEQELTDLTQSIAEHGVVQPIIVRSVLKGYEIVAGERRWRASKIAEKKTIPAVVRTMTDQQVMEVALIENVQRSDLNAVETATAYEQLIEAFGLTQEQLAVRVGKSRSHVANMLRLLRLPQVLKTSVAKGTLTMGHVRALLAVSDEEAMVRIGEQAVALGWSVRHIEQAVAAQHRTRRAQQQKQPRDTTNPFIADVEGQLRKRLQAHVRIRGTDDKGKIEISYASAQHLQTVLHALTLQ
jgi:ParB family chromosome partitioning protein